MDEAFRQKALEAYHRLMDRGLRVLAFAYRDRNQSSLNPAEENNMTGRNSGMEEDLVFVGLIGLEDPPRPEVPEAIRKCHGAGIRVIMITGDGSRTAVAIAREFGRVRGEPVVIEGPEFLKMDDGELRKKLSPQEIIFARMTPKHKMRMVSVLQEEGERVAVTGSGPRHGKATAVCHEAAAQRRG